MYYFAINKGLLQDFIKARYKIDSILVSKNEKPEKILMISFKVPSWFLEVVNLKPRKAEFHPPFMSPSPVHSSSPSP